MCRIPTADETGAPTSASDEIPRTYATHHVAPEEDNPASTPQQPNTTPDMLGGVQNSAIAGNDVVHVKIVVVVSSGNGLATIVPERAGTDCPTDDGSDLESVLIDAEW
jgi:hypothetical protein